MYTLSKMLQDGYRKVGTLEIGLATGGSTATSTSTCTIVDSAQVGKKGIKDDVWKDCAMFVVRDAAGAGAAPEGEVQRISAYDAATGTFTMTPAFSANVAVGDTYAYGTPEYPLRTMIELANSALQNLGYIALIDKTTLDTSSGKSEYAASVAWKRKPTRVDVRGNSDSDDNMWIESRDWDFEPSGPGSAGLIIFGRIPESGMDIRVWYEDVHPTMTAYSSIVSESIDPELAALALAEKALGWQNSRNRGAEPFMIQLWNDVKNQLASRMATTPVYRFRRKPKLLSLGVGAGDIVPSRYGPVWRK